MRRFLVCLLVAGAGAAFGQTPTTYTNAGAALVAAFEGLTSSDWQAIMSRYNQPSWPDYQVPVSWVEGSEEYTGHVVIRGSHPAMPQMFDNVLGYFYEVECQTARRADCSGLSEAPQRRTGTGLDDWYDWTLPVFTATFPEASCPELGDPPVVEVGPVLPGKRYEGASLVMSYRPAVQVINYAGVCQTNFVVQTQSAGFETWTPEPCVSGCSSTPAGAIAQRQNQLDTWIQVVPGGVVGHGRPVLSAFQAGSYRSFPEAAEPHPDLAVGLGVVFTEVLAEFERVNGEASLPAGMYWSPVPTAEQLGAIEPPGEPEPVDPSDPGNCEEGWYLTRVVCEIRTAVNNTWQFLSHDAWVPQEDWAARFSDVRDEFDERTWYLRGGAEAWGLPTTEDLESIDHLTHEWCALELDLGLDLVGPFMPGSISEEPVTGEFPVGHDGARMNWCMTPPATWMAGTGRAILAWFLAAGFIISLFGTVTGRA